MPFDTVEIAASFRENGYVVMRGFFSRDEAARILADVEQCVREDREPAALTDKGIVYTGGVFSRCNFTRAQLAAQKVIDLIAPVAGGDLWVVMDQAVTKHPGAGVFRWHQDNGYNHLKRPHYQLWIALTPTRKKNGALTLAPGSHRRGLLPHKWVGQGQMEVDAPIGETVTIDADAGDVILFSSLLLHCTGPNEADAARVAYVAEYMPLADYAWMADPPFYVVAEHGVSAPHFVREQRGAGDVRNRLMYAKPQARALVRRVLQPIRDARDMILQRR